MEIIESKNVIHILQKTLSLIDPRLVDHGSRVSYILYKMMQYEGKCSHQQMIDICLVGLLHDVGAFKTDEIDRIVQFETLNTWGHSIYGYLFVKNMTPLSLLADSILYHHLDQKNCSLVNCRNMWIANRIHLADRVDVYLQFQHGTVDETFFEPYRNTTFSSSDIELFLQANETYQIVQAITDGTYINDFSDFLEEIRFTDDEIGRYLKLLAYSIDFRSEFTVAHTITTVSISVAVAKMLGLSTQDVKKVYYGAWLHDIGKIATPLSILESKGKLDDHQMGIMKNHVEVTEEILKDYVNPEICNIAVRHHEKLDGSGYPKGLTAADLSVKERIVAIADIMSALNGKRSYKEAFPRQKIIGILTEMAEGNKLSKDIVEQIVLHYDGIMETANYASQETLNSYENMQKEYQDLCDVFERLSAAS
ncbi:MAG TPA: HD domain-containing phosphohydrolase [Oscillospiraceae bacterium]|nr:HD domain-containing phosphohydrolase [Oscillospiraceae bacterium]